MKKYGAMDPVFSQAQYSQIPTAVIGIAMKFFQIVRRHRDWTGGGLYSDYRAITSAPAK